VTLDEFVSRLKQLDVRLSPRGHQLHVDAPRNRITPDLVASIAVRKAELLALLGRRPCPYFCGYATEGTATACLRCRVPWPQHMRQEAVH